MTQTAAHLVAAYVSVREAVREKEAQHAEEIASLKEEMDGLSAQLLDICNAEEADSIKTPYGTASRKLTTRYWTNDWESMYEFIKENNAPFLLEQRIHTSNMKAYLQENPEEFPMGLQADQKFTIVVRKPTAK